MVKVQLASGVSLDLDDASRKRIAVQLGLGSSAEPQDDRLSPGHWMWWCASGGNRWAQAQFGRGDEDEALRLRRGLSHKARVFFEELLTDPGRLFSSDHFVNKFEEFDSRSAVAGCLKGFSRHCERANRSLPFFWWECAGLAEADASDGSAGRAATLYAIRHDVAEVFIEVGP